MNRSLVLGLPLGPLLVPAGYLLLAATDITITDAWLLGLVAFPTAALLLGAASAVILRRDAARWLWMALGAAIGTAAVVGVVGGGISAIAWMLSDPG